MTLSGRVKTKDEEQKAIALVRVRSEGVTDVKIVAAGSSERAHRATRASCGVAAAVAGLRSAGARSRAARPQRAHERPRRSRIVLVVWTARRFRYRAGQVASLAADAAADAPYSIASAPEETAQRFGDSNS